MSSKLPTLTIAIPSYELGESLELTLKSLLPLCKSPQIKKVIIAVDGNQVDRQYRDSFKHPKLQWYVFPARQGQSTRLNDIFGLSTTDYLLITNDDVLFSKRTMKVILQALAAGADLYTTQVLPQKSHTYLQQIINVGNEVSRTISQEMGLYRNYLSCNGRCLVLSRNFYHDLKLPKTLWNNDAYIYLQCEEKRLHHRHLVEAEVYYQLPQLFSDYVKQWRKFHFSQEENQSYFKKSMAEYYRVNTGLMIWSLLQIFRQKPLVTTIYISLQILMKVFGNHQTMAEIKNQATFWETDHSTKKLRII